MTNENESLLKQAIDYVKSDAFPRDYVEDQFDYSYPILEAIRDGYTLVKQEQLQPEKVYVPIAHVVFAKDDLKTIVDDAAKRIIVEYNWHPIKLRPMTEEEKEQYSDYGVDAIYACELPDNGDEVLITTKYGYVTQTTFYDDDGCYFEQYEDTDEVLAWMPKPTPYKEGDKGDD